MPMKVIFVMEDIDAAGDVVLRRDMLDDEDCAVEQVPAAPSNAVGHSPAVPEPGLNTPATGGEQNAEGRMAARRAKIVQRLTQACILTPEYKLSDPMQHHKSRCGSMCMFHQEHVTQSPYQKAESHD